MATPGTTSDTTILRYALVVAAALSALIVTSLFWTLSNLEKQVVSLATIEALSNWNKDQAFRRWATRHGGLYVKPDERTPPNPYLDHLPNRDVETTKGEKLTLMNMKMNIDSTRAERELGFSTCSLEEMFTDSYRWMQSAGIA